jgi:import inner membrane translocase subunit TIM50
MKMRVLYHSSWLNRAVDGSSGPGTWRGPSSGVRLSLKGRQKSTPAVQLMHSTLLSRRLATALPSAHSIRTFSVKPGPIPPKNATQGASDSTPHSQASDNTPTPRPAASVQNTPIDTQNVSESDPSAAPSPSPTTLSLDFAPPEPGTERERTGAKSSKDSLSSIERRRRQLGRVSFGLFALGLVGGCVYLGREWTEDELVLRKSVRLP